MDMFGRLFFFASLTAQSGGVRYLSITVEPPECLAEGTVAPFLVFPVALPQPSSQEIPEEPEAHTWVCYCTREGGLLCGAKFSTLKTAHHPVMHTQGGTHVSRSWSMRATITKVCSWCELLQPHYNVPSHTETTGNWNLKF